MKRVRRRRSSSPNSTKQQKPKTAGRQGMVMQPHQIQEAITNPTEENLNPEMVLTLQRRYGNQFVQRLVDQSRAHTGDAAQAKHPTLLQRADDIKTIQRLIGYEIETGIPAVIETKSGVYEDPTHSNYKTKSTEVTGDKSAVDVDESPSGGGYIIEFVSDTFDETKDPSDFKAQATKWVGLLSNLKNQSEKARRPRRLSKILSNARKGTRYGMKDAKTPPSGLDRVSIQMTHGLRLDKVAEFFNNLKIKSAKTTSWGPNRQQLMQDAANKSPDYARITMNNIKDWVDPASLVTDDKPKDQVDKELTNFSGFLALIFQAMFAGQMVKSGYFKNRSSVFYKSKLSDVRNSLISQNDYAKTVLTDDGMRDKLVRIILSMAGQKPGGLLFSDSDEGDVVVDDWLKKVLKGEDDPAFEASKNPWGTKLGPEDVDGEMAAVVEQRQIMDVVSTDKSVKLGDPQGVIDYLTAVYIANQKWEGIQKDEDKSEDSESDK